MAKTKQEIRVWLDRQVGQSIAKTDGGYPGQCVSLIQALLAFLGASDGKTAMGHAKDFGDALVARGIAKNGKGWLNICVNRNMGWGYGHVWIDLYNETNYEQNGAQAFVTTKGTRPVGQAQQIINLDQYVTGDAPAPAPQPAPSGAVAQLGTFESPVNGLRIRRSPSMNGAVVGQFDVGGKVKYDCYVDAEGYRWISWIGNSGNRNYAARRTLDNSTIFGKAYQMILSDNQYNKLKWIALIALPALGVFYATISKIWGLPFESEIPLTTSALGVFIGALIKISENELERSENDKG